MTGTPHPLQSIFHPKWTPSLDSELLKMRDQGTSLSRIATALMREPKVVEQRWHRLRVVPGVREQLRKFGKTTAEYPVQKLAEFVPDDGACAP